MAIAALAESAHSQETIPTWETAALWSTGAYPFGIDAADAVGPPSEEGQLDGYPDLVVAIGQVSFLHGDSPGGWTRARSSLLVLNNTQDWAPASDGLDYFHEILLPEFTIAAEVVWADITGDGRLDVVCSATHHYANANELGAWGIYVYDWDGTNFGADPYQYIPSSFPLRGLIADDFDNDGDVDVAAAVDWPEPVEAGRDRLAIFDNVGGTAGSYTLGNESLTSPFMSADEAPTGQLVWGHFDKIPGGAAYSDVFTPLWDGNAGFLTGTSSGFNQSTLTLSACNYPGITGLTSARFTLGDLSDDIAAAGVDGMLYIFHGNSLGDFAHNCDSQNEPDDIYFDGTTLEFYPYDVASGHLNGGTKPDLVFGVRSGGYTAHVWMLLGLGNGKFQHTETGSTYQVPIDDGSGLADSPIRVIIADMDQDGFGDVLTSNHGSDWDEGSISVVINAMTISP